MYRFNLQIHGEILEYTACTLIMVNDEARSLFEWFLWVLYMHVFFIYDDSKTHSISNEFLSL